MVGVSEKALYPLSYKATVGFDRIRTYDLSLPKRSKTRLRLSPPPCVSSCVGFGGGNGRRERKKTDLNRKITFSA